MLPNRPSPRSPATWSVAADWKATKRPCASGAATVLSRLPPNVVLPRVTESTAGKASAVTSKFRTDELVAPSMTRTGSVATAPSAGAMAINCVLLTKVVASTAPLNDTWLDDVKPVPLTVSVKAGLPAPSVEGERETMVSGVAAAVTERVKVFEATPLESLTCTVSDPAAARSEAGTVEVN